MEEQTDYCFSLLKRLEWLLWSLSLVCLSLSLINRYLFGGVCLFAFQLFKQ